MPTNLGHEAITAKLGHADPSMYLGHEQIYPNTTTVSSFAFADTSTVPSTGATRVLNIGGDIGSTFTLTGAQGAGSLGAQSLSSTSQAFNISIGNNHNYGSAARSPSVTISPTGNTTLAGGVPTSRTLTQAAGPTITNVSVSGSNSSTTLVNNTTTVNGQLRWASGAKWRYTFNISSSNVPWAALETVNSFWTFIYPLGTSSNPAVSITNNFAPSGWGGTFYNQPGTYFSYIRYQRTSTNSSSIIPTGSYGFDFEITNSCNPTYVRFNTTMDPWVAYNINNNGAGQLYNFGYLSLYP